MVAPDDSTEFFRCCSMSADGAIVKSISRTRETEVLFTEILYTLYRMYVGFLMALFIAQNEIDINQVCIIWGGSPLWDQKIFWLAFILQFSTVSILFNGGVI